MPYLQAVIDWIESEQFEFECGEDVNSAFEDIDNEWQPNNRFTIPDLLGFDLPDLMLYLQEQIDNECEDDTEIISFPKQRTKKDEDIKEEILDTEIELLHAKKELLEQQIESLEASRGNVFRRIEGFFKNIFRG